MPERFLRYTFYALRYTLYVLRFTLYVLLFTLYVLLLTHYSLLITYYSLIVPNYLIHRQVLIHLTRPCVDAALQVLHFAKTCAGQHLQGARRAGA